MREKLIYCYNKISKNPLTIICAVLIGYLVLTVFFTYPLINNFTTGFYSDGGDGPLFLWNLWWVKFALLDLKTNPFHTDYIFYPNSINLTLHELTFLNGLISIPFQLLFDVLVANNILTVLSFVLSGFGTYLLINYLVKNRLAAFIGGFIFAFCPYRFAHLLGHYDLITTQWIPFYVLFLIRMTKEKGKLFNAILAGIFLLFNVFSAYYYLFYLIIFTFLYLGYVLISDKKLILNRLFLKKILTFFLTFFIIFLPLLIAIFRYVSLESRLLDLTHSQFAENYVADLAGFFTPSVLHPVLGEFAGQIAQYFRGNTAECTVFIGFTVIILTTLAIIKFYNKKKDAKFWSFSLIVFLLLSLGLFPHFLGRKIMIPLPFFIIYFTPILKNVRIPARFLIMAMLCCAILSSFSLVFIFDKLKKTWKKSFAAIIIIALISFEYLARVPIENIKPPLIYEQIKRDKQTGVVLEIPLGWQDSIKLLGEQSSVRAMYYQSIHQKPIFGGYVSRFPSSAAFYYLRQPIFVAILELQRTREIQLPKNISQEQKRVEEFIDSFNLRYIIIHSPYLNTPVHEYIENIFPLNKIYEDAKIVVYRIKDL
ncbi:MAG: hypothetical protein KJ593_02590 [Candidatus Omnitrophica bacterium]|nr:hypothetical protein [Candidatus Omnitrophota bacterium]